MVVAVTSKAQAIGWPRAASSPQSGSGRVFTTVRRRRRGWPGASMRTSLRFGDVDGYENARRGHKLASGHGRCAARSGVGARSLNVKLQQALNPPGEVRVERFGWTFCPGDKAMQVVNDHERQVYNGDLGVVARMDTEEGELVVDFEGREVAYGFGELDELVLGYAVTVHKSQGSEYPAVVVPLTTQHFPMLQRNLVYTGVTRGKRLVVLVGQRKALAIAVRGQQIRRRWSKLKEWLAAATG